MNLYKKTKDILYITWHATRAIFTYPQRFITPGDHFNYDEYWKAKRGIHMQNLGRWQKKRALIVINCLKGQGPVRLSDIGAGSGEVSLFIQKHASISEVIAYDSSEFALAKAREAGMTTVLMDINKQAEIALLKPTDYSLMFEILEHIPGPEELLKKAFETSSRGVFFSFPNTGFVTHRLRLLFGKFPLQWRKHPGEHLRFWTRADLKWWLRAQGYAHYTLHNYVGIPLLRNIWPSLFCAGFFVEIKK